MDRLTLESGSDILQFDAETMRLVSARPKSVPEQEFICSTESHPAFEIGYLKRRGEYHVLSSNTASKIAVASEPGMISAEFLDVGALGVTVRCSARASAGDRFVRWGISVENSGGLDIVDVQYPFVVCPYTLGGDGSEAVVLPHGYGSGKLLTGNLKFGDSAVSQRLMPDSYIAWEFSPRQGNCNHYPGMMFAQYLAYYNSSAGFYIACDDTQANVKRFQALHREPGMRLGISHVGDWPASGMRELEYNILTTSFAGDWYDATDIYREWSFGQHWFMPLTKKTDVPEWLLDSPAFVTVRSGGVLDFGQVYPVDEFVPYGKCIPLLERLSERVGAPLTVVLMGWENAGSWVYPDAFPPVGGEESMRDFMKQLRQRGFHGGSFCSGTRWAFDQSWSGYDGRDYLDEIGACEGVCKQADGSYWPENWDPGFRSSWSGCLGTKKMRETALSIVGHLIDWGMESLQFLDQNNGGATFPCFADDHGHPDKPGKWMYEAMRGFAADMHKLAADRGADAVVHSAESGLNETCIPFFQETELRISPDGYGFDTIPIYQYLFHECLVLHGMMGNAPEPYHLVLRNAANCVLGSIPGGVMTGDGSLLDKDTMNWANWDPKVEDEQGAYDMIRTVCALRRGEGKPFLVYGRMLRPAAVDGIAAFEWTYGNRHNSIKAVFHRAWQSPEGKFAVVLANWTPEAQNATVSDARLGANARLVVSSAEMAARRTACGDGVPVALPPHSCALVIAD